MNIRIGAIDLNELNLVYEIDKSIFPKMNYPIFVLRQYYDLFPKLFLVARNELNEVLGYAIGGLNGDIAWLLALGTKREFRKMGIASSLLKELINKLKEKKVNEVLLTVEPNNKAIKLYKNMGFEKTNELDNYYGNNEQRIIMKKLLTMYMKS